MRLIKSYIAHMNWMKAHAHMASISPDTALLAIRKAVKVEPDERIAVKYLELQGHIEAELGKKGNAIESFEKAISITEKHDEFFNKDENLQLKCNILAAYEELKQKT